MPKIMAEISLGLLCSEFGIEGELSCCTGRYGPWQCILTQSTSLRRCLWKPTTQSFLTTIKEQTHFNHITLNGDAYAVILCYIYGYPWHLHWLVAVSPLCIYAGMKANGLWVWGKPHFLQILFKVHAWQCYLKVLSSNRERINGGKDQAYFDVSNHFVWR